MAKTRKTLFNRTPKMFRNLSIYGGEDRQAPESVSKANRPERTASAPDTETPKKAIQSLLSKKDAGENSNGKNGHNGKVNGRKMSESITLSDELVVRLNKRPKGMKRLRGRALKDRTEQLKMNEIFYRPHKDFEKGSDELDQYLRRVVLPESEPFETEMDDVSGLSAYMSNLGKLSLLNRAEEQHLFRQMNLLRYLAERQRQSLDTEHPDAVAVQNMEQCLKAASEVSNGIARANMRMVFKFAQEYSDGDPELFDALYAEGETVLVLCIRSFDYGRGNKFVTPLYRSLQYKMWGYLKKKRLPCTDLTYHDPETDEEVDGLEQMPWEEREDDDVDYKDEKDTVDALMGRLNDREAAMVSDRYGLADGISRTLQEVGNKHNITKERARQILAKAEGKLRDAAMHTGLEFRGRGISSKTL